MSTDALADPIALLGVWRLEREIDDRFTGTRSRVEGRLELTATTPDRVRWAETGRWRQAGGDVEVHRSLWVDRVGGAWWVRFEDGRDFHPWAPGEDVVHDCAPDTYCGVVSGSMECWTVRWDVTGPRKDYTMTTVLTSQDRTRE